MGAVGRLFYMDANPLRPQKHTKHHPIFYKYFLNVYAQGYLQPSERQFKIAVWSNNSTLWVKYSRQWGLLTSSSTLWEASTLGLDYSLDPMHEKIPPQLSLNTTHIDTPLYRHHHSKRNHNTTSNQRSHLDCFPINHSFWYLEKDSPTPSPPPYNSDMSKYISEVPLINTQIPPPHTCLATNFTILLFAEQKQIPGEKLGTGEQNIQENVRWKTWCDVLQKHATSGSLPKWTMVLSA